MVRKRVEGRVYINVEEKVAVVDECLMFSILHIGAVKTLILRLTFYAVAGVLLASISWSTMAHSVVTGDYLLSFILLGMMFYIVGQFCVDRWRPEAGPQDFHATRLWKTPYRTTVKGLWLRVCFITLVSVGIFTILAATLVLFTTAQPAFMILLGSLFFVRIPHLYWSMRGMYDKLPLMHASNHIAEILIYRGHSQLGRRARWLLPTGMAGLGIILAGVGVLVSQVL